MQHTLGLLGYLMNKMGRNLGGAGEKEMELGGWFLRANVKANSGITHSEL